MLCAAFDSWVMRNSAETGIAPDAAYNRGEDWAGHWPSNSSGGLNRQSVAAWGAAVATNAEVATLKSVILSATSSATVREPCLPLSWPARGSVLLSHTAANC